MALNAWEGIHMYVELQDISKQIRRSPILNHISVGFEKGRIYGLKGKNGSGKTMLLRMIAGLILPNSGQVLIDGKILGKDMSFPASIGILIENPSFISGETGLSNLSILASIQKKADRKDLEETLERVGLDPGDKRTYRKYSLGMKQRLGIAAAIMEKPDIILLDEPINALDDKGVEAVRQILAEEKERGALIIIACHDEAELKLLSDEIFYMQSGEITGHEVLKNDQEDKS